MSYDYWTGPRDNRWNLELAQQEMQIQYDADRSNGFPLGEYHLVLTPSGLKRVLGTTRFLLTRLA